MVWGIWLEQHRSESALAPVQLILDENAHEAVELPRRYLAGVASFLDGDTRRTSNDLCTISPSTSLVEFLKEID